MAPLFILGKTVTIASNDSSAVDDHAIADSAPVQDDNAGIDETIFTYLSSKAQVGAAKNARGPSDPAFGAYMSQGSDGSPLPYLYIFCDIGPFMNSRRQHRRL